MAERRWRCGSRGVAASRQGVVALRHWRPVADHIQARHIAAMEEIARRTIKEAPWAKWERFAGRLRWLAEQHVGTERSALLRQASTLSGMVLEWALRYRHDVLAEYVSAKAIDQLFDNAGVWRVGR